MTVQYVGYNDEINIINGKQSGKRTVYYMTPEFEDKQKSSSRSKTLALVPLADSFAAACSGPKTLSSMTGRFGSRMASWGGAYAAYGISRGISNLICKKSDSAQDLRDNHPLVSLIGEFGLFLGIYNAGRSAIAHALPKISESYKTQVKESAQMVKTALENSKFNEKVFKPAVEKVTTTLNANPKMKQIAVKGLKSLAPALIVLSMLDICFIEPLRREKQQRKAEEQAIEQMFNAMGMK